MGQNVAVPRTISYGPHVNNESELRLCGDPNAKRAIELGISPAHNAVTLAELGAKAIAVDPRPEHIAAARRAADAAGVRVEFHEGELGDLGFATSASVDLVVAADSLAHIDDLARVLRQVHRVLKPECALVIATAHPMAGFNATMYGEVPSRYGTGGSRSISDWFTSLYRSNFRVDSMHELFDTTRPRDLAPSMLVVRARKLGV